MLSKSRNRFITRYLSGLLLVIALQGCGFKLAGTGQLPESLSKLHLVTSDFSDQQRDRLSSVLQRAGVKLTNTIEARATLSVKLIPLPQRTVVSSASSGITIVRLARQLDFSLKPADDSQSVRRTLVQQKNFELDDDNLLSSDQQKTDVIRDLEQSLFNQLVFQMQRI